MNIHTRRRFSALMHTHTQKAGALKQASPLIMSQMAGNKGFDPLGFASTEDLLLQYREAELKHARLAMLASVGWVMSELLHTPLAELLGLDNLLQADAGKSSQTSASFSFVNWSERSSFENFGRGVSRQGSVGPQRRAVGRPLLLLGCYCSL